MAYGCVYEVTGVVPGSEYQLEDVVCLECVSPCVEHTVTSGPNAGCVLTPLSPDCMTWPPERPAE